jgi:predicted DNA-binding transcriptional regulator YafY
LPEFKQSERLIQILQRLALDREVTVRSLYKHFNGLVEIRTLQRDLKALSGAGIPLVDENGNGREKIWKLEQAGIKFIPQALSNRELLASYFLERLAEVARGTKLEKDVKSLLRKAKQAVKTEFFQSLDELNPRNQLFGATFTGYIDYAPHSESIDTFIEAASKRERCRFIYKAHWKAKESDFEADPYMLVYHKGALYGIVWVPAHDNYIFLAIQRIKHIEKLEQTFKRRRDFNLRKICDGRFGIYGHEGLKPQKVVLKFSETVAETIAERVWHPSQKITRHKDGTLTLELTTIVSDELRSWVAGWLEYVEVSKPKDFWENGND